MLDIGASVSPLVIRDTIMTILLNALLALPVFTGSSAGCCGPCWRSTRSSAAPPPPAAARAGPLGLRGLEI